MSDIACFINIFSTDPVTKNLERVDGASSPLPWYLWAKEVHPGVQRKCIQGFLCFFPLNSTSDIYIASAKYSDSPNFVEFFVCHGPIILRQVSVAFKVLQ